MWELGVEDPSLANGRFKEEDLDSWRSKMSPKRGEEMRGMKLGE
jgi:hypothetical protein